MIPLAGECKPASGELILSPLQGPAHAIEAFLEVVVVEGVGQPGVSVGPESLSRDHRHVGLFEQVGSDTHRRAESR